MGKVSHLPAGRHIPTLETTDQLDEAGSGRTRTLPPSLQSNRMTNPELNREAEGLPLEPEDEAVGTNAASATPLHPAEYRRDQTSLGASSEVTILKASDGFGWTGLYAALTDERPHEAFHRAIPDIWFATTLQGVELSRTTGTHRQRALLPADLVSISVLHSALPISPVG